LAAERLMRMERGMEGGPLVVLQDVKNRQVIVSLNTEAEQAGLMAGQTARDAQAICPTAHIRLANPQAEQLQLNALRRWAGKFSPWVAAEAPAGLILDINGCANLFGGEEALLHSIQDDCGDLGFTVLAGIADTVGAAWALARFSHHSAAAIRTGDDIQQEARATRSRAARRHWTRGGTPPNVHGPGTRAHHIATPGQTRQALVDLPVAALRLNDEAVAGLTRLGLRKIGDMIGLPRAALTRRVGQDVMRRLDQALGLVPEPVAPARAPFNFAVRLTLPDPIGLEDDIMAGLDRLLGPLGDKLRDKGHGARRVRLQLFRTDHTMQTIEVGLAVPSYDPERMRPLLALKMGDVDAWFGIDRLRLEAHVTEPVYATQHAGHAHALAAAERRQQDDMALPDLIGRLGARIGLDQLTRHHPGDSHIPEKTFQTLAAAWSEPFGDWPPMVTGPRP
ncbi:MAG: DNA polymerase Y family protein, partial [Pseudomonadota bacterium]|nr:DNA polymerase Y family protein [Pseudomonadota bacterium]